MISFFWGLVEELFFGNMCIGIKQGIFDFDYVRIGIKCQKAMMIV